MSRIGRMPIAVPAGVEVRLGDELLAIKGGKGSLEQRISPRVRVTQDGNVLHVAPVDDSREAHAMSGTYRALIANMVEGVSAGFERRLQLVGVGYRAQAQGQSVNLSLGFSHPVVHRMPAGVQVECPTQTEIVIRGADKQAVGQVAAEIRAYRPPEPYKGKGVRYAGERIRRKEGKKK